MQPQQQNTSVSVQQTLLAVEQGLKCRTMDQALAAPTFTAVVALMGYEQTFVHVCAAIRHGMKYFSDAQRLNEESLVLLAEQVMTKYRYESLDDLVLFFRRAALGEYGEKAYDGQIVKKGETYGQLTLTRIGQWWEQYLEQKADALSELRSRESGAHKTALSDALHPSILKVVKDAAEKASEARSAQGKAERLEKLRVQAPKMSDDELREAWSFWPSADERAILIGEAEKRGLVAKAQAEAIAKTEQE